MEPKNVNIDETRQSEDANNHEPERTVSSPSESWINRNSKAITALTAIGSLITTAVLAIFAYFSWSEVQEQRNLAFKQFVLANAPSVRIYVDKGFKFEGDVAWMVWRAENRGGPVHDVEFKSILMCCGHTEEGRVNLTKFVIRTSKSHRLNRMEMSLIKVLIHDKDTLRWLKSFVGKKSYGLYLYVRAEYKIPSEISLSGQETRDSTYRLAGWEPYKGLFESVKPQYEKMILKLIEERQYISIEHQG